MRGTADPTVELVKRGKHPGSLHEGEELFEVGGIVGGTEFSFRQAFGFLAFVGHAVVAVEGKPRVTIIYSPPRRFLNSLPIKRKGRRRGAGAGMVRCHPARCLQTDTITQARSHRGSWLFHCPHHRKPAKEAGGTRGGGKIKSRGLGDECIRGAPPLCFERRADGGTCYPQAWRSSSLFLHDGLCAAYLAS